MPALGEFAKGFGGGFFLRDGLLEVGEGGEGVVRFADAGESFRNLALGHGCVLAGHERGRGALAFVDLVLKLGDLLLELVAGIASRLNGSLHGLDLLVGFCLAGERLAGEIFVTGVERLTGARLPLGDCFTYFWYSESSWL